MGTPLSVGDVCKVLIVCRDIDQVSINTVYYLVKPGLTGNPDTQDFAVQFSGVMKPVMIAWLTSQAEYRGILVYNISVLPLERPAIFADVATGTGGAVGAPRQAAGLISFAGQLAGPGNRGRIYLPFVDNANLSAFGILSSGAGVPKLQAISDALMNFTSFINAGDGANVEQVIKKKPGLLTEPIINWKVTNKLATQKRRGSFGKTNASGSPV